jgi:hypothetical protein
MEVHHHRFGGGNPVFIEKTTRLTVCDGSIWLLKGRTQSATL